MSDNPNRDALHWEKKQKFMQEYIEKQKKKQKKIMLSAFTVVAVVVGIVWYLNSAPYTSANSGNYFVQDLPSYQGRKAEMVKVAQKQDGGEVRIPIADIEKNSIVRFEYDSGNPNHEFYERIKGKLPLMAYVSTSGRVVVASSICEPCYGTEFYLQDQSLVCVACGTRWRNTDLFGEGGGCVDYPPEELKYTLKGDSLVLPQDLLIKWKPRFFREDIMS